VSILPTLPIPSKDKPGQHYPCQGSVPECVHMCVYISELKSCHSLGSSIDIANVAPEMPGEGECREGAGRG